jgi:hypothetical protein
LRQDIVCDRNWIRDTGQLWKLPIFYALFGLATALFVAFLWSTDQDSGPDPWLAAATVLFGTAARGWLFRSVGALVSEDGVPHRTFPDLPVARLSLRQQTLGSVVSSAIAIIDAVGPWEEAWLWIHNPDGWNRPLLPLYYRIRQSHLEPRLIGEAPVHFFLRHEYSELTAFVLLSLLNEWEWFLVTSTIMAAFMSAAVTPCQSPAQISLSCARQSATSFKRVSKRFTPAKIYSPDAWEWRNCERPISVARLRS